MKERHRGGGDGGHDPCLVVPDVAALEQGARAALLGEVRRPVDDGVVDDEQDGDVEGGEREEVGGAEEAHEDGGEDGDEGDGGDGVRVVRAVLLAAEEQHDYRHAHREDEEVHDHRGVVIGVVIYAGERIFYYALRTPRAWRRPPRCGWRRACRGARAGPRPRGGG